MYKANLVFWDVGVAINGPKRTTSLPADVRTPVADTVVIPGSANAWATPPPLVAPGALPQKKGTYCGGLDIYCPNKPDEGNWVRVRRTVHLPQHAQMGPRRSLRRTRVGSRLVTSTSRRGSSSSWSRGSANRKRYE
jgi:hypothetical protein